MKTSRLLKIVLMSTGLLAAGVVVFFLASQTSQAQQMCWSGQSCGPDGAPGEPGKCVDMGYDVYCGGGACNADETPTCEALPFFDPGNCGWYMCNTAGAECVCEKNQCQGTVDCAGVCNGGAVNLGCGCGLPGPSGCDNACGSTKVNDACNNCGGNIKTITCTPACGASTNTCGDPCTDYSACVCSDPTPCGTYPNCKATSGCDNACGSTKVNDACGACGGSVKTKVCAPACGASTNTCGDPCTDYSACVCTGATPCGSYPNCTGVDKCNQCGDGTECGSCTGSTPCGTYPSCYGVSGCDKACDSTKTYDACGTCGGGVASKGTCNAVASTACVGTYATGNDNCGTCEVAGTKNCGGCTLGDTKPGCTNASGCPGSQTCNSSGSWGACDGPSRDACGTCGGTVSSKGTCNANASSVCIGSLAYGTDNCGNCSVPGTKVCGACTPNTTRPCGAGVCGGTQTCDASGNWGTCSSEGAPCASGSICTNGTFCTNGICPSPTPVPDGNSCGYNPATCQNNLCEAGTCTVQANVCGPGPCTYTISPPSASVSATAGSGSFNVSASSGSCAWTASVTSGGSWQNITNGANHTGSASVTYSYAANGSSARSGTIVAGGQTFTLNQAGSGGGTVTATKPTCGQINVSWSNLPGAAQADQYLIYQYYQVIPSPPGFLYAQVPASSSSFIDTNVSSGLTYVYWVAAYNSSTHTIYTQVPADTNPSGIVPDSCPIITATNPTCGQINLSWQPLGGVAWYNVWRNTVNSLTGATMTNVGNVTSYADTTAAPGTFYYYWLQGSKVGGGFTPFYPANTNSSAGIAPKPCDANLNARTDKHIEAINDTAVTGATGAICDGKANTLSSSTTLKLGDKLKFSLNLCNTGNGAAASVALTDNMTNLTSLTGQIGSATNDWNVYYDPGSGTLQRLGSGNSINFSATGNLPNVKLNFTNIPDVAGGTDSNPSVARIFFEAKLAIPSGFSGTLARFQNLIHVTYSNGLLDTGTPPLPFYVGGGAPTRKETGPQ